MAAAISRTASQNADTVLYLEEKTLASFVAENRLNQIKLTGFPAATQTKDDVEMANREWHITTKVEETPLFTIGWQVVWQIFLEGALVND